MAHDHPIPREDISRMLRQVHSDWELEAATPIDRGLSRLCKVEVFTDGGIEPYVLKVTPEERMAGVSAEARLVALLRERTSIPLPDVLGVVDRHGEFPTPYFVMEYVSGTANSYEETRHLPDTVLESIARQTGAYLAELHAITRFDSFGRVWWDGSDPLRGEPPTKSLGELAVIDQSGSWLEQVRSIFEADLDTLGATEFANLEPALREWTVDRLASLANPMQSILGRVDHGLHNLIIDSETGDIRAVIDWGFTLAVTPHYDLKIVEWVLSGAMLSSIPHVPDRSELVRKAMINGYRNSAATPIDPTSEDDELYEVMAVVRSMIHLHAGVADVPERYEDVIADGLRNLARAIIDH